MKIGCHLPMFGPVGTRESVLTVVPRLAGMHGIAAEITA